MSKQNDFFELIRLLWDIEQFDMWYPNAHSSLAYLIDRCYETDGYAQMYSKWLKLLKEKDFNELAWSFSEAILKEARADERVSEKALKMVEYCNKMDKDRYEKNELSSFGNISEEYAPDWFWEIFEGYMELERIKRENAVKDYMLKECKMSPKRAEEAYLKLKKHCDLLNEFYFYVKNGRFMSFEPQTSEGISAEQLFENTYLSPLGAYNYLIYLRESPKEALADLKKGLPRK